MNNKFCITCQWYVIRGHGDCLCGRPPEYGKVNLVNGKITILHERKCEDERSTESIQVVNKTNTGFATVHVCGEEGRFYFKKEIR